MVILVFEYFFGIQLLRPHLNNFSLLSHTQLFNIRKAEPELFIDVPGKEPSGLHVIERLLIVPEIDVVPLIFW